MNRHHKGQPALFADRGFTGHEYLSLFKLYNMNGRMYDPAVGRFLNVDPVIQDPTFTQNYNRYSYCFNNPLKYSDLTGETVPLGVYDTGGGGNDRFWERTYQFRDSGGKTYTPPNNGGRNNGDGGDSWGNNGSYALPLRICKNW